MTSEVKYSVIIPVYNRPQEVEELLESLTHQTYKNFEVLLVEDGSTDKSQIIFEKYTEKLTIQYLFKPNSGPGPARNFGYQHATGSYLVVFDSDCIIPPEYFDKVEQRLLKEPLDAWGGPDRGRDDFTEQQQAMAYTMSAFLTTGGIRGGKKQMNSFQPRSFNMGIRREVFQKTGGFQFDRYAEDIEFSIRIKKAGFKIGYIEDAFVFHKRRTDFGQFYTQVFNFGRGRAMVGKVHPNEIKITHWFPSFFTIGLMLIPVLLVVRPGLGDFFIFCYSLYFFAVSFYAYQEIGQLAVAILAIPSAAIQMVGYGLGFLKEKFMSA